MFHRFFGAFGLVLFALPGRGAQFGTAQDYTALQLPNTTVRTAPATNTTLAGHFPHTMSFGSTTLAAHSFQFEPRYTPESYGLVYVKSSNRRKNVIQRKQGKIKPKIDTKSIAGSDGLDCPQMLRDTVEPLRFRNSQMHRWKRPRVFSDSEIAQMSCSEFRRNFYFPDAPLTQQELEFPLGFSVIVSEDADQVVRLLQSVYWPQNQFCFHVDGKSDAGFKSAIDLIISCFPNFWRSARQEDVYWGHITVLEAALHCFETLNDPSIKWKYMQILSSTDVPLKTNFEMVQILKIFNGANDVEMQLKDYRRRYLTSWKLSFENVTEDKETLYATVFPDFNIRSKARDLKPPPPHGLEIYKGSFASTLSREFVNFVLTNPVARDFRAWLKDTYVPDEFMWSSLVHNNFIDAPGEFPGECMRYYAYELREKPWISRYQVWESENRCGGTHTHTSCVFGVGDLPSLRKSTALVAHKFYRSVQPTARHCLLELHYNRTYFGREKGDQLDLNYYLDLPSVRYREDPVNFIC